jgi:hypothetical protein
MHIDFNTLIATLDTIDRLPNLDATTIQTLESSLYEALAAIETYREAQRTVFTVYDAEPHSCDHLHVYT